MPTREKDRRSASGRNDRAKKGGKGGAFTWEGDGSEDVAPVDKGDPNYVSDEEERDEAAVMSPSTASLHVEQMKTECTALRSELNGLKSACAAMTAMQEKVAQDLVGQLAAYITPNAAAGLPNVSTSVATAPPAPPAASSQPGAPQPAGSNAGAEAEAEVGAAVPVPQEREGEAAAEKGRRAMLARGFARPHLQRFDSAEHFAQLDTASKLEGGAGTSGQLQKDAQKDQDALKGRHTLLRHKLAGAGGRQRFDSGDYFSGADQSLATKPRQPTPRAALAKVGKALFARTHK